MEPEQERLSNLYSGPGSRQPVELNTNCRNYLKNLKKGVDFPRNQCYTNEVGLRETTKYMGS